MNGLTLATLRTHTREVVGDNGATAKAWSDGQVNDAVNVACLKYAELTSATYTEASINNDSAGRLTMPADFTECIRVFCPGYGLLDVTTVDAEDMRYPLWRSTALSSGQFPARYAMWDRRTLQLFPRYTLTGGQVISFSVGYVQNPVELVADGDTPDIRIINAHHHMLKFGAAWFLLQNDIDAGSRQQADLFWQEFVKLIEGGATTDKR